MAPTHRSYRVEVSPLHRLAVLVSTFWSILFRLDSDSCFGFSDFLPKTTDRNEAERLEILKDLPPPKGCPPFLGTLDHQIQKSVRIDRPLSMFDFFP